MGKPRTKAKDRVYMSPMHEKSRSLSPAAELVPTGDDVVAPNPNPNPNPTLLDYLSSELSKTARGSRKYTLHVVRSIPRRSHALFPHASNLKTKVWQEEVLVILSEELTVLGMRQENAEPSNSAFQGAKTANDKVPTPYPDLILDEKTATPAEAVATATAPANMIESLQAEGLTSQVVVPIVGIEASIYTIPSTSTSLLYISKVDTTGLSSASVSFSSSSSCQGSSSSSSRLNHNPTRSFVGAFLSYHLLYPPHQTVRLRVHIFARSQGQYLFPGSVDNTVGKRVLDDKGLLRWWKNTISHAVREVQSTTSPSHGHDHDPSSITTTTTFQHLGDKSPLPPPPPPPPINLFYLIPGLSLLESLPYVPPPTATTSKTDSSKPILHWNYGHAYSNTPSPLHLPHLPIALSCPLTDHIPSFPDDPKSRFMHSLTSSTVSPSGAEGDYDDVMLTLSSTQFTTGTFDVKTKREAFIQKERDRERDRLIKGVPGGVDEWWERMAFRQECCAGQLVGFFTIVRDGETPIDLLTSSSSSSTHQVHHGAKSNLEKESSLTLDEEEQEKQMQTVIDTEREGTPLEQNASTAPCEVLGAGAGLLRQQGGLVRVPGSFPHATFTSLWSQFHNVDYSLPAIQKCSDAARNWEEKVLGVLIALYGLRGESEIYESEIRRKISVDNPIIIDDGQVGGIKRGSEAVLQDLTLVSNGVAVQAAPKVNILAPRKKKKV